MASEMGNSKVAEMLIEAGADWEVQDEQGFDCVDIAKVRGNDDVVELIKTYANKDVKKLDYLDGVIRL